MTTEATNGAPTFPLEMAYGEACKALGEAIVLERLLTKALNDQGEMLAEASQIVEVGKVTAPPVDNNGNGNGAAGEDNNPR